MKKYGGFVPGIRPGQADRRVPRLHPQPDHPAGRALPGHHLGPAEPASSAWSAAASQNFPFGGTAVLIMVGVGLETVKQIESQLMQRNYEGFLRLVRLGSGWSRRARARGPRPSSSPPTSPCPRSRPGTSSGPTSAQGTPLGRRGQAVHGRRPAGARRGHHQHGPRPAGRARRRRRLPARRLPAHRAAGRRAGQAAGRPGHRRSTWCWSWSSTTTRWSGGCPAGAPAGAAARSGTSSSTRRPARASATAAAASCSSATTTRPRRSPSGCGSTPTQTPRRWSTTTAPRASWSASTRPGPVEDVTVRAIDALRSVRRMTAVGACSAGGAGRSSQDPEQIGKMRAAGLVVGRTRWPRMRDAVAPGVTHGRARRDRRGVDPRRRRGAVVQGLPRLPGDDLLLGQRAGRARHPRRRRRCCARAT